jgi:hypothetical protein
MQLKYLYIVCCLFFSLQGLAQDYIVSSRKLTTDDGLSNNQIQAIHQDRLGLIWIATKYGLNRFDGHNFEWFTKEKNGLRSDEMTTIFEDDKGRLWLIATEEYALFQNYVFIDIFNTITNEVHSFEEQFENCPFKISEIESIKSFPNNQLYFKITNNKTYTYTSSKETSSSLNTPGNFFSLLGRKS